MAKKIKIPKVDPDLFYKVEVYKTKYRDYINREEIVLKPQIIEGFKIPKNAVINAWSWNIQYDNIFGTSFVLGSELNKLLRFLYLEELRKGNYNKNK